MVKTTFVREPFENFSVDLEVLEKFKKLSNDNNLNISIFIQELMEKYIKENEIKKY